MTTQSRLGSASELSTRLVRALVAESVGKATDYFPRIGEAAATACEYRTVRGKWPTTKEQLVGFAEEVGFNLDLSDFSELEITPSVLAGGARMNYVIRPKDGNGQLRGAVDLPAPEQNDRP